MHGHVRKCGEYMPRAPVPQLRYFLFHNTRVIGITERILGEHAKKRDGVFRWDRVLDTIRFFNAAIQADPRQRLNRLGRHDGVGLTSNCAYEFPRPARGLRCPRDRRDTPAGALARRTDFGRLFSLPTKALISGLRIGELEGNHDRIIAEGHCAAIITDLIASVYAEPQFWRADLRFIG